MSELEVEQGESLLKVRDLKVQVKEEDPDDVLPDFKVISSEGEKPPPKKRKTHAAHMEGGNKKAKPSGIETHPFIVMRNSTKKVTGKVAAHTRPEATTKSKAKGKTKSSTEIHSQVISLTPTGFQSESTPLMTKGWPLLEPPQRRGPAARGFVEMPRKPPKRQQGSSRGWSKERRDRVWRLAE